MNKDARLVAERYLLMELKNSKAARAQVALKYGITDRQKAGDLIEDFMAVQHKMPDKDMFSPEYMKDATPEERYSSLIGKMKKFADYGAKDRKKEQLIEWAKGHPNKIAQNEKCIAVRIEEHEESHLFSQVTSWCTTTSCRKNWDRYKSQGVTFIYVVNLTDGPPRELTPTHESSWEDSTGDYYALALYDMSWEDLYSVRPEVGNFDIGEYEDGDVEIGPMMSIYEDLGGDESEWQVRATNAIDDFHEQDMDDDWTTYYAEIRDDFAQDFFKLWNESTGGMNAAEGFDDEDNVVSPWRINKFFELNILKVVDRPSQDRREANLLNAGGDDLDALYRVWETTYQEIHKDEGKPDVRWAKRVGLAVDSPNVKKLKVRWPEFESKIWEKLSGTNAMAHHNVKQIIQHVVRPYLRLAIPDRWPQAEGFLTTARDRAIDDFGELYSMMRQGKLDKQREENAVLSTSESYSGELANTLYDKCAWMNVWLNCLSFAEDYFSQRAPGGQQWWKDNMVIMSNHKEMRDEMYSWLSEDPKPQQHRHQFGKKPDLPDLDAVDLPDRDYDPTTGLDYNYRRAQGFATPEASMNNGARLAYFKLPNFPKAFD